MSPYHLYHSTLPPWKLTSRILLRRKKYRFLDIIDRWKHGARVQNRLPNMAHGMSTTTRQDEQNNTRDTETKKEQPQYDSPTPQHHLLRIAIVGGGATGLTAALHLAPLAERGLIAKPIHLYEKMSLAECRTKARKVGVGIWSTALEPFCFPSGTKEELSATNFNLHPKKKETSSTIRDTHAQVIQSLEKLGSYIQKVGYRTPDGNWLLQGSLNIQPFMTPTASTTNYDNTTEDHINTANKSLRTRTTSPSLLFIRECDFLDTLREAVFQEERKYGTIQTHYGTEEVATKEDALNHEVTIRNQDRISSTGKDDDTKSNTEHYNIHGQRKKIASTKVQGIKIPSLIDVPLVSQSPESSAKSRSIDHNKFRSIAGLLEFSDGSVSEPYHVVIAADGMDSILRSKYAGHLCRQETLPFSEGGGNISNVTRFGDNNISSSNENSISAIHQRSWDKYISDKSIFIEDRKYTVFRGNAPIVPTVENDCNFQTWGEGKSMRFAAVRMSKPIVSVTDHDGNKRETRDDKQVWFATTSDKNICNESDPVKQKDLLIAAFEHWHEPIAHLIRCTPVNEIYMDRGKAHKHSVRQVFNLDEVLRIDVANRGVHETASNKHLKGYGSGPIILFTGDACMTVDPVLAQGFTMGMESAADLARTIEKCFVPKRRLDPANGKKHVLSTDSATTNFTPHDDNNHHYVYTTNVETLQSELKRRQDSRCRRILYLLRATELVQALAQPDSGPLSGRLSRYFIRPSITLFPSYLKEKIFMYIIKYSLGLNSESCKRY